MSYRTEVVTVIKESFTKNGLFYILVSSFMPIINVPLLVVILVIVCVLELVLLIPEFIIGLIINKKITWFMFRFMFRDDGSLMKWWDFWENEQKTYGV